MQYTVRSLLIGALGLSAIDANAQDPRCHFAWDPCDREVTAALLSYGSPLRSVLDFEGDEDYFRIDLNGRATVELRTSGDTDTYGRLYDSDGIQLGSDDDAATDRNFRIVETLGPGAYYVRVEGFNDAATGDYSMVAKIQTEGDDHGNNYTSSSLMEFGAASSGAIQDEDDVDVFRLDVTDDTRVRIRSTGPTDVIAGIWDGTKFVAQDDDSGSGLNFDMSTNLERGIYYLVVEGYHTGAYRLLPSAFYRECPAVAEGPADVDEIPTAPRLDAERAVSVEAAMLSTGVVSLRAEYPKTDDG